ncbi:multidrug effflux MFS transporter [Mesorhizobium sp. Z1-4]|uniref:multidrug effflux MFS transporter n=1 Tax=Mesorhizobium sp. Z1-4 TaxID=2448478 RepID=UPI000FDB353D|nr:multidrug effflux MFS transporter [Mesorhizobium sp. Z1-4]
MNAPNAPAPTAGKTSIPRWEFIALAAALMALNALAVDIMLPGLQQIGAALGENDENNRQLVITAYLGGFALAQLVFGPLSDRFGRRPPLLFGLAVYVVTAFACVFAPSFGTMLAFRFVQGLGAAATRVITVSVVRDSFGGRAMAEVMSLIFMVFMVIPVLAPGIGQAIMIIWAWPEIFLFMSLFGLAITLWTFARLPETLHEEYRRPFKFATIVDGFRIVLTNRISVGYSAALAVIFGALFGFINSAQQIYVDIYDKGDSFPLYFALVAGTMALMSFINSRMVGRFGMRRLAHAALVGFMLTNGVAFALAMFGPMPFWLFIAVFMVSMAQFALIGSNFNALAMEPLGHVAGTASSILGFAQTACGAALGALVGQAFNGTIVPLAAGYFFFALSALVLVLIAEGGVLFRPQNEPPRS